MGNKLDTETPILLLITGAPGSGKSTLAKALCEYIQFLYIDTDAVLQNFWLEHQEDEAYDREMVGVPRLYQLTEELLVNYHLNLIVDMTPTDEKTIARLHHAARIVHLHCRASNAVERFYAREVDSDGNEPDWLGPHMHDLKQRYPAATEPPDLGSPVIEVSTNDGYEPGIKEIVERAGISDGYRLWNNFQ